MKKIIATMVILVLLMASNTAVFADSTSEIKSIDTVISDIREELNLKATDPIYPEKVTNDLLEQLGDSVMEAMIGNHDLHEQMDARMGGDGSATLTSMHIRMGYEYLYIVLNGLNLDYGTTVNSNWINMMGYTGWGMMKGFVGNSMMNYSGWGMMNNLTFDSVKRIHYDSGYMMGNQYWKSNGAQQNTPSGTPSQATTGGAVTQSWSSQTPCWNNGGSIPGSTYSAPNNSTKTTNSGNWNNMQWNNNGMMN